MEVQLYLTIYSHRDKAKFIIIIIQSKFFFLFIGREPTRRPANNCLQIMVCSIMCNAVQQCLAADKRKPCFSPSCDRSCVKMADGFASQGYSLKKQTWWSNDETIIELGYRKISWFVSVSAHHGQITTFFSTSSNNC